MTLAAKQRLVAGVLAILAIWPLGHRALVARYRLSPWRFFGWAMYCTPKLPVQVEISASRAGARRAVLVEELPADVGRAVQRLSDRRAVWGSLASPDRVGAQLLAALPDADAVEVGITHWFLDPDSARIAAQRYDYAYRRAAP